MSYNHRQAVIAAEDHVLQLGKLLEKGSLSDLVHPAHAAPEARWRAADFAILRNESEETEADERYRKIYTPLARELSGFMYRITDGAMDKVLKNTDFSTFFGPIYRILAEHVAKPRPKDVKRAAKSAPEPAWELLAMRACISHALAWLKKVKPKPAQAEVEGLVEDRPASFEEYLRRRVDRSSSSKKDVDKAAEELSKSMDELAAEVKGLAQSGIHEIVYIAGIPGYLTAKAWFPMIGPFLRINEKQLEKVHKRLLRLKLDPAPAMSQLYGHYMMYCGHLGVDSKGPADKVKPRRKS